MGKESIIFIHKNGIENYCPLIPAVKQWTDRKKTILELLFTFYVFVRIDKANYISVLETDGVVFFIKEAGQLARIPNEEIEDVRNFLLKHNSVSVENIGFQVNDKVRIMNGALQTIEREIKEVRIKTVRVPLPSIGFKMVAEPDKNCLQKIAG